MTASFTLALLLAVALLVTIGLVIHSLAQTLLYPPRMTVGKAMYLLKRMLPEDVGLASEPMMFSLRDAQRGEELRIAGWWIEAAGADRTCVLIHGYGDAKVGALAWAPTFHELGWNMLLIDLRGHGESGGRACTGAYFERDDVEAVLNQLRVRRPDACKRLVLFGVSLGGAVALAVAARRTDVDAVVADGVFADYGEAALTHGRLIGAPLPGLVPLAVRWAEWMSGSRFNDVRPVETITKCPCPVLLIHGGADVFVPEEAVTRLHAALGARGGARDMAIVIPGAGHCMGLSEDQDAYTSALSGFLTSGSLEDH